MDTVGRTMPYSAEAEQSVLGGILIDSNCISAVSEIIKEEDFYLNITKLYFLLCRCCLTQISP